MSSAADAADSDPPHGHLRTVVSVAQSLRRDQIPLTLAAMLPVLPMALTRFEWGPSETWTIVLGLPLAAFSLSASVEWALRTAMRKPTAYTRGVRNAMLRMPAMLCATLLVAMALMGGGMIASMALGVMQVYMPSMSPLVAQGVGLVVLLPQLLIGALLINVVPVMVAENKSVFDALRRSEKLSKGHRLSNALLISIPGLVTAGLGALGSSEEINYIVANMLYITVMVGSYAAATHLPTRRGDERLGDVFH